MMNQRIRELMTEAGYAAPELSIRAQKLAELIVEECFKAAMVESKGHMNPIDLMKRMKERVGVEE